MYAVQPVRAEALRSGHARNALRFRPARVEDAEACAPLIFVSGVREFSFFLGEPAAACIDFLAFAFTSKFGRFSYRRHRVAVSGDQQVAAVLAVHDGRDTWLDDPHVALMLLMFFGVRRTVRMLLRGLVLESELPAPKSSANADCPLRDARDEAWHGRVQRAIRQRSACGLDGWRRRAADRTGRAGEQYACIRSVSTIGVCRIAAPWSSFGAFAARTGIGADGIEWAGGDELRRAGCG
jgi:hypothetical protein